MVNRNTETGIAYGYISANSLHPDVVDTLQMDGRDVYYEENWKDFVAEKRREYETEMDRLRVCADEDGRDFVEDNYDAFDPEEYRDEFNDTYMPDEPIHEGEHDGVKYRTSWLGGALNVWVFESLHIGNYAQCSPCVPGAGDLNTPDADGIVCYDVPPDWRDTDD